MDYLIKVSIDEKRSKVLSKTEPTLYLNLEKHSVPGGKFGKGIDLGADPMAIYPSNTGKLVILCKGKEIEYNNLKPIVDLPLNEKASYLESFIYAAVVKYLYIYYDAASYVDFDTTILKSYIMDVSAYLLRLYA